MSASDELASPPSRAAWQYMEDDRLLNACPIRFARLPALSAISQLRLLCRCGPQRNSLISRYTLHLFPPPKVDIAGLTLQPDDPLNVARRCRLHLHPRVVSSLSVGLAQKTRELFRAICVQSISIRRTAKMSVT